MTSLTRITMALACVAGCSSGGEQAQGSDEAAATTAAGGACEILTAADVSAITGVSVSRIDRNPAIGAGGTCANFAGEDGQVYLGVNRLAREAEFAASVNAVPVDLYPEKVSVPNLGEEAVLFKAPGGLRYLIARQGASGVVLFPLGAGLAMSDQQLTGLAERALASAR